MRSLFSLPAPARARWRRLAAAAVFASAGIVGALPASAQEVQRIIAVVNDDVISNSDLTNRIRLMLVTSGMPDSPENRRRVQTMVVRGLIDERLQEQDARRLGIGVTNAEVDEQIARIEQSNQMPKGQIFEILSRAGIPRSALSTQIRVGLMWQKISSRRIRPNLTVGEDEANSVMERFASGKGITENLLAEIFLAIDNPDAEEEVHQHAISLLAQIKGGTPFSAIAQQFSQSASAASGGDIGWVQQNEVSDDPADALIAQLQPGRISEPIRTSAGFYIYLLRERRLLAAPKPDQAMVSVAQLVLPLPPRPTATDMSAQTALAETVRETVSGCADLKRVAEELGAPPVQQSPAIKVADLSADIRPVAIKLKVGEASAPVRIQPGLMMVMVCTREDPPGSVPTREEVMENIGRQRLDMMSRRYLRDLRRSAVIDIRG